jgi:hypothetical protein
VTASTTGAIAQHSHSIADQPAHRQTLTDQPRPVTSLVFFDFSQLLRLAERTGLTRGARYRALRPDLGRIRAIGLETTRGRADSTPEITLQIR